MKYMKNMKTLGLLALAAMGLAAFIGTASASAAKFTAGAVGKTLTETTTVNHVFTVTGSEVVCDEVNFVGGTEALEKETQTVNPSYSSCEAFGFANATVNTAGCSYTLNANGSVVLSGCTAGGITITVEIPFIAKCSVEVKKQTGITGLSYANVAGGDIQVTVNSSNVDAEVLVSTGACPLTVGTHKDGASYTGKSTISAEGTTISWHA